MDARGSFTNWFPSWLIPVRDITRINLCFEDRIFIFLVRPADSCNYFCVVSMLQFVILLHNGATVAATPHKSGLSGLRSFRCTGWNINPFSFSKTEVSFRIATRSHSELFLRWWPSDLLKNISCCERISLAVLQYTIQFFCLFQFQWP